MSVLFKALQKAEKENEQRQAATSAAGFDPERLAGSGVIRAGASRAKWRVASLVFLLVAIVGMGGAYYFTAIAPAPTQVATAPRAALPVVPVQPATPPAAEPAPAAAASPAAVTPPPTPDAPKPTEPTTQVQVAAAPSSPAPAAPAPAAPAPAGAAPTATPDSAQVAAAPAAPPAPASPAAAPPAPPAEAQVAERAVASAPPTPKAPPRPTPTREPMPTLAADSPARMLEPPISVRRRQADLEGAGDAVKVRNVSQVARDNVGAAYNALIRGEYDTALGFYGQALKEEPRSVLALLGRGTALQKLGRKDEARTSYQEALKTDPQNREALTNLTALEAERAPGEALQRLIALERDHPNFSPIKAQIGMVHARLKNYDAALEYLRRAVALTPEATLYHYNLALVLDHLGWREEAVSAYQQVLALTGAGRALPELSVADVQRRVSFLRAR